MKTKIPIRFFIITFVWTWLFLTPLVLIGIEIIPYNIDCFPIISSIMRIIAFFGPVAGAFISLYSLKGKDSIIKYLKSFLSFNFGWKVWLSIFFVISIISIIAWIIPDFFGKNRLPVNFPNVYIFPLYLIIQLFIGTFFGGGQEEVGWRGYILPYLEKRFGLILGSLIIGIIWCVWHFPLKFIPGTFQSYMSFFDFGGYFLFTIGLSYFFSWIKEISSNRLMSGLIVHGTVNAFAGLFPYLIMESNMKQIGFWIYSILIFIIGMIIVIIRTHKSKKTFT